MTSELRTTLQKGLAFHQAGRIAEARRCYEDVLKAEPDEPDANHLLGVLLVGLGMAKEGIGNLRRSLEKRPTFVQAHVSLGHALIALGNAEGAAAAYREALARDPKHLEALCHLAKLRQDARADDEALELYRRALELRPVFPEVLLNLGNVHLVRGDAAEALKCYLDAASQRNGYAEAWNGAGASLLALRRAQEALVPAEKAVELKPVYPEGHNNLGNVLLALDRLEEAEAAFRKSLSQKSGYAEALSNLGNTLLAQNRHQEACAAYEAALQSNPSLPDAAYNLGLTQLALGQMEAGWQRYELRWKSEMKAWAREWKAPLWEGMRDKPGQTILVHAEQGLGDTLQFCRYLPLLQERGFEVVFEAQPALTRLMRLSFSGVKVIGRGERVPDTDWRVPLLSLPRLMNTTLASLPKPLKYLKTEAAQEAGWKKRLESERRLKVGVVWSGNPQHKNDRNRSLTVGQLRRAFEGIDVAVFGLQKEVSAEEGVVAHDWMLIGGDFIDFLDTAAAVAALDLVITVDTSVAHLAGGLGRPVWTLLPFAADWRWMVGRGDSPWYPSMRLFRQIKPQTWNPTLESVRAALAEAVKLRER